MGRLTAALALAVSACGLSAVGSLEVGSTSPPDRIPSGADGAPSQTEASVPCDPDACALPGSSGFSLLLYGDRTVACPDGFDTEDAVEAPVANAGSCGCGTCAFSGTTCNTGLFGTKYADDNACNDGNGSSIDTISGGCNEFNGQFISTFASIQPPPAVAGSCSAPGVGVPAQVSRLELRLCAPRAEACNTAACSPPGTMKACVAAPGDVACPAGLTVKHLVGANVALTCTACTCTTNATCGGSAAFYPADGCVGTPIVLASNVCTMVNQANIRSIRWTGMIATQTCSSLLPAAQATVALEGPRTICCP